MTTDGQTSPAIYSNTSEINFELNIEPIKGLKIQLTANRTDNHSRQIQFMYDDMPTSLAGSYTKTHCAIRTALTSAGNAADGYNNAPFNQFLGNIPVIAARYEAQYAGLSYPTTGFMSDNPYAGMPFNTEIGQARRTGSDILIPAFIAAYTGTDAATQYLDPFPSLSQILPNWRITYDGLINLGNLRNIFKAFTLTHAYQCTYTVGSYSSYLNWISADGSNIGFTLDELTGEAENRGKNAPERPSPAIPSRGRLGIVLCFAGAVCLALYGTLLLLRPAAAERLSESSTVTLDGSGLLLLVFVLLMAAGAALIFRKK